MGQRSNLLLLAVDDRLAGKVLPEILPGVVMMLELQLSHLSLMLRYLPT